MNVKKCSSKVLVLALIFSLILTTCMGMSPGFSRAKKKKSGITVTNKKSKGFLEIRVKKESAVKTEIKWQKSSN